MLPSTIDPPRPKRKRLAVFLRFIQQPCKIVCRIIVLQYSNEVVTLFFSEIGNLTRYVQSVWPPTLSKVRHPIAVVIFQFDSALPFSS